MNRRAFLTGTTLATGAALLGGRPSRSGAAEPPLETTKLRVALSPAICFAPQYLAGDGLLQAEGFTSIEYVKAATGWGSSSRAWPTYRWPTCPRLKKELKG